LGYLCAVKPKDPVKIQTIYHSTLELVSRQGLVGFNMAELAKHTGLGTGTIYGYFAGKEQLINNLFKELKTANTALIYAVLSPDNSFVVNFKLLYINYLKHRIGTFKEHFFLEQCAASPYLDAEARLIDSQTYRGLIDLLNQGKAELALKPIANEVLVAYLLGSCNELVNLLINNNMELTEALIEETWLLIWHGIRY
jgi:TetR/AcrR family transcriptional regulator, repressor of fatR-cypB operon